MRLVRVTGSLKEYDKVKRLYISAFPSIERTPWLMLIMNSLKSGTDFWAVYDRESWIGLAYVVHGSGHAYLFYLAIDDGARNNGYGSRMIRTLMKYYEGSRIFLAIEPLDENADNNDMRIRRHDFYIRNGFRDTAFSIQEGPVIYDIMAAGGRISPKVYMKLMRSNLGFLATYLLKIQMFKKRSNTDGAAF